MACVQFVYQRVMPCCSVSSVLAELWFCLSRQLPAETMKLQLKNLVTTLFETRIASDDFVCTKSSHVFAAIAWCFPTSQMSSSVRTDRTRTIFSVNMFWQFNAWPWTDDSFKNGIVVHKWSVKTLTAVVDIMLMDRCKMTHKNLLTMIFGWLTWRPLLNCFVIDLSINKQHFGLFQTFDDDKNRNCSCVHKPNGKLPRELNCDLHNVMLMFCLHPNPSDF